MRYAAHAVFIGMLFAGLGLLATGCSEKIDPEVLRQRIDEIRAELDTLDTQTEKASLLHPGPDDLVQMSRAAKLKFDSGELQSAVERYEELLSASKEFIRLMEETAWAVEIESEQADWAEAICAALDGGYVVAGVATNVERGDKDVYLAKFSATGEELWRRAYGGSEKELAASVRPTPDGGYLLSAQTSSFKDYSGDVLVVKTDANGVEEWSRTYGRSGTEAPVDAIPLGDGRILIVARAFNGADGMDVYTVLTDSEGEILHEARAGGAGDQYINSVVAGSVSPNGFQLAGVDGDLNLNATKPVLINMEIAGDTVKLGKKLAIEFGGFANPDSVFALRADGGTVMTAGLITEDKQVRAWSGHDPSEDIVVMAVDSKGAVNWQSQFGGGAWDSPRGLAATDEGGYTILAQTKSYGAGEEDLYMFGLDASGAEIWARTIGTDAFEVGHAFYGTPEGGFLVVGATKPERRDSSLNTLLVKTDATGRSWRDNAIYASEELVSIVVATAPEAPSQGGLQSVTADAPKVGEQAPEIEAAEWLHTDDEVSLAGLRGHIVVVEFWATWCGPCRSSTPHLVELSHQYKDQGVTFLGMTEELRSNAPVDDFIEEFSVDYIVGVGSAAIRSYGVRGIPTAFVVDGEGIVQWVGHPMNGLDAAIEAAVRAGNGQGAEANASR